MLTFGSVFAGIGGIDLGLERAGMLCKWQIENDPYASAVLAKHWPDLKRYGDVREVVALERVDLICGGFPCQDISHAGKRVGIRGERSGLFFDLMRLVRVVRPRFVLLENVAALLARGMGDVLGELAKSGFDAEWDCIPAAVLGAPHLRDRVFIVAYSQHPKRRTFDRPLRRRAGDDGLPQGQEGTGRTGGSGQALAYTDGQRFAQRSEQRSEQVGPGLEASRRGHLDGCGEALADSERTGLEVGRDERRDGGAERPSVIGSSDTVADSARAGRREGRSEPAGLERRSDAAECCHRLSTFPPGPDEFDRWSEVLAVRPDLEPAVRRVAHGIPDRINRLRCLGNAVVPQVAEAIGRMIVAAAEATP